MASHNSATSCHGASCILPYSTRLSDYPWLSRFPSRMVGWVKETIKLVVLGPGSCGRHLFWEIFIISDENLFIESLGLQHWSISLVFLNWVFTSSQMILCYLSSPSCFLEVLVNPSTFLLLVFYLPLSPKTWGWNFVFCFSWWLHFFSNRLGIYYLNPTPRYPIGWSQVAVRTRMDTNKNTPRPAQPRLLMMIMWWWRSRFFLGGVFAFLL